MGSPLRIANGGLKGGIGKTTMTIAMADDMATRHGLTVLVLDVDPQACTTGWLGIDMTEDQITMNDVIYNATTDGVLNDAIVECPWEGSIWAVPSELELASRANDSVASPQLRIKRLLRTADLSWVDVVLMDCPPSLGGLFEMCLNATDKFVLVTDSERGGMNGLGRAVHAANVIAEDANPALEISGIVMNQFDQRRNEHKARWEELGEAYPDISRWKLPEKAQVATSYGASIPPRAVKGSGPFIWPVRDVVDHLLAERD